MANEAEFTTFNITDDQDITPAVTQEASQHFQDALQYYWDQDNKTEWIDSEGKPMGKPSSVSDWRRNNRNEFMGGGGVSNPRYFKLNKIINKYDMFFRAQSDEEIRKALKPPNDMGKFAQQAYAEILKEKNKQDNLLAANEDPDTDYETIESLKKENEEQLNEDQKEARQKALANAAAKAEEQKNEAIQSIQPAKSLEFKQQNFLQAKMLDIIKHRHRVIEFDPERQKSYPYQEGSPNACIMLHGDPATCINDLLIYPDTETFFQMKSADIANLQPEIRLFKVFTDPQTRKEQNIEMNFDTTLTSRSLESLLTNRKKRGTGVGIKEFNISFIGTDVFSANKSFKANLKIYANSFEELFVPRGPPNKRYRYVDLALKTGKKLNEAVFNKMNAQKAGALAEDLARLDYSIKLKLGIKEPKTPIAAIVPGDSASEGSVLKSALGRNSLTLHLTPTIHSFNFNPDGSVMFEIEYLPFQNQRFSGNNFDVFTSSNTVKMEFDLKTKSILYKKKCASEELDNLKKEQMKKIRDLRNDAVASIISNLHSGKKVNYLQVHPEVLEKFTNNAAELTFDEILKLSENAEFVGNEGKPEGLEDDINKDVNDPKPKPKIKSKVNSPTINTIPYVFISDIIDVVLASITKSISPQEIQNLTEALGNDTNAKIKETRQELSAVTQDYVDLASVVPEPGMRLTKQFEDAVATAAAATEMIQQELDDLEEFQKIAIELIEDYKRDFEDFRKFRVVLGPVELVNPFNQDDVLIASLGDIPISLPYLQEFLTAETLKNNSRRMPFSSFINKLMNKLVKNALNDDSTVGGLLKQKVRLAKTEAMCINKHSDKTDDLTHLMMSTNRFLSDNYGEYVQKATGFTIDDWSKADTLGRLSAANAAIDPHTSRAYLNYLSTPVLEPAALGEDPTKKNISEKEMNYLIFYAARTNLIGFYRGDRADDSKRGVHHYSVGRDRGIIKEIKLTRDTRKGIREARFEQEGFDGLQQLREVYSVDVDCYANFNVFPGTKIFVDPRGWVPNLDSESLSQLGSVQALTDFGIGGYYDVMKVDHSFGVGRFDTSFTAKWTAQIDSPRKKENSGKPSEKEKSKCKFVQETGVVEAERSTQKGAPGSELAQLASRAKALAVTGFNEMLADSGGLLDRAKDFFPRPSDGVSE